MRRDQRGLTLLEVLVALVIVSTAGISLVAALGAAVRSERSAEHNERSAAEAHRLLGALSLLARVDLDRGLGTREIGELIVNVQRPEPTLYRIAIAERRAPEAEVLVTVVYRPEEAAR